MLSEEGWENGKENSANRDWTGKKEKGRRKGRVGK
jgi:hypothetical protein